MLYNLHSIQKISLHRVFKLKTVIFIQQGPLISEKYFKNPLTSYRKQIRLQKVQNFSKMKYMYLINRKISIRMCFKMRTAVISGCKNKVIVLLPIYIYSLIFLQLVHLGDIYPIHFSLETYLSSIHKVKLLPLRSPTLLPWLIKFEYLIQLGSLFSRNLEHSIRVFAGLQLQNFEII